VAPAKAGIFEKLSKKLGSTIGELNRVYRTLDYITRYGIKLKIIKYL
jgi:hypothetical protein